MKKKEKTKEELGVCIGFLSTALCEHGRQFYLRPGRNSPKRNMQRIAETKMKVKRVFPYNQNRKTSYLVGVSRVFRRLLCW